MPVYNDDNYVSESVESVLKQTHKNFEFIIVNDCSNDRTPGLLARYQKKDKRIKLIHNRKNEGYIRSLNTGLRAANAPYIARIDSDDTCHPRRLEKQVDYLTRHPRCVLLGTQINFMDENGKITGMARSPETDPLIRQSLFLKKNVFTHSSAMYVKKAGFYYRENAFPADDYDFWLRLLEYGEAAILNEILVNYRVNYSGVSYSNYVKQIVIVNKIRGLLIERIKYKKEIHALPNLRWERNMRWNWVTSLYENKRNSRNPLKILFLKILIHVISPEILWRKYFLGLDGWWHRRELALFLKTYPKFNQPLV